VRTKRRRTSSRRLRTSGGDRQAIAQRILDRSPHQALQRRQRSRSCVGGAGSVTKMAIERIELVRLPTLESRELPGSKEHWFTQSVLVERPPITLRPIREATELPWSACRCCQGHLLKFRTPERYSLMVLGEWFAASKWTCHDPARRERSGKLSTRFVAGVAQSAERFTRKYLPMNAVPRAVSPGSR
jgi:hypothetical protein